MKLLFVVDHFLPGFKAGGPIKSIAGLYKALELKYEITILTVDHDFQSSDRYDVVTDTITYHQNFRIVYLSNTSLSHISKTIKVLNPDIIYLNSFFSHFSRKILLINQFLSLSHNIILAPRGELSREALSIKRFKKTIYLWLFKRISLGQDVIFHTTDEIEANAVVSLFPNSKIVNIPNITVSIPCNPNLTKKQTDHLKILFLSRISAKKNLLFALEILNTITTGMIKFDIYGPIEDEQYWKQCMNVIHKMPSNINVRYKGAVHPSETSAIFRQYHLFFLPTLNENFGHAIVEAMQNGVLPLLSTNTPWNQMHTIGWTLPLNDKNAFISAIYEMLRMDDVEFKKRSSLMQQWIQHQLKSPSIIDDYMQMFKG